MIFMFSPIDIKICSLRLKGNLLIANNILQVMVEFVMIWGMVDFY